MVLGKLGFYMQKNDMELYFPQYTVISSKWVKKQSVRAESLKLLEENMWINLSDLRLGNRFLDMTSKVQNAKETINKCFIKILKLWRVKNHYQENEKTTY